MTEVQQPDSKARLEVNDKRVLFQSLLAMTERLLYLNKFPVDQEDFALSLLPADREAAIRLIREQSKGTICWNDRFDFKVGDQWFFLHKYPNSDGSTTYRHHLLVFPRVDDGEICLTEHNKYGAKVLKWAEKQLRLEDQILRTAVVLKAIVQSCNTVGQYQRVSPELVMFLPDKYRLALQDYTKASPYPAITVEPEQISAAIDTLAFAALQNPHISETEYTNRPKYAYGHARYDLCSFPRTAKYHMKEARQLQM